MLGIIQGQLGKLAKAETSLRRAININPENFDALANYGLALFNMGQAERAIVSYRKALTIVPDHASVLLNMGNAYAKLDQLSRAAEIYEHVLQLDPSNRLAHGNLANVLAYQGRAGCALSHYFSALGDKPEDPGVHSNLLLCLHYTNSYDPDAIYREHLKWAACHVSGVRKFTEFHRERRPDGKIKIGYVTPDLKPHSVACFLEPLLCNHDRDRFEIYCYAELKQQDGEMNRLWNLPDVTRSTVNMSDDEVAELIYRDGIDILIDLAGHTENNRLPVFARKPAPIQMTYLGYPDTTGMDAIDYRITDHWADPPGMTEHLHTEHLVRLDNGFLCFKPPQESPAVTPLPADEQGFVTFGSFNALTKITHQMLEVWARLLYSVDNSRLLIKNRQLTDTSLRESLAAEFERLGISRDRVDMLGITSKTEHMASYGKVDIALDTYPYNGTTTTCDCLWMGLPVISMSGRTHVSRVGVSLLSRVGLDNLICVNEQEYMECAVRLSMDMVRLRDIRMNLRGRMKKSRLCDSAAFTREFEKLLSDVLGEPEK